MCLVIPHVSIIKEDAPVTEDAPVHSNADKTVCVKSAGEWMLWHVPFVAHMLHTWYVSCVHIRKPKGEDT